MTLQQRIEHLLAKRPGMTLPALVRAMPGARRDSLQNALRIAMQRRAVHRAGSRRSYAYFLSTAPARPASFVFDIGARP